MRTTTFHQSEWLPESARGFFTRRFEELTGAAIIGCVCTLGLALATWSVGDPSLNHATDSPVHNLLGFKGAVVADLVMQMLGVSSIALLAPLALLGWRILSHRGARKKHAGRLGLWLLGAFAAAGVAAVLPATDRWPLPSGLGGLVGDMAMALPRRYLSGPGVAAFSLVFLAAAIFSFTVACGFGLDEDDPQEKRQDERRPATASGFGPDEDDAGEPGLLLLSAGLIAHACGAMRDGLANRLSYFQRRRVDGDNICAAPRGGRVEPSLGGARDMRADFDFAENAMFETAYVGESPPPRQKKSRRPAAAAAEPGQYIPPALSLLVEPKRLQGGGVSDEALEQNARLLEGVLDDFSVKGDILKVHPGPVVTLYELEPAPGVKSSRVIGLADDIARSMSSVSARVAVVPGRNAIGIELPNQRRETVYLRELIASPDFVATKHKLAIALGKTIGGEPVIVDLARMPHLLVAGTTGSGKSVAINTMILSLLYRLKPEECRLIMVDPKMLELSVYDGIPHLLTPVVTDPKKAVVALKWAVREMEDRYKKMSKLGVRNIDGFNARVAEAKAKGEIVTRTVQTGFDRETGEAIYEQEQMDLAPLPYIIVIVDEMADLMMVAGKDIEGAIQRLAQMARAAGIHIIMATQRPSVDVITGTIKANFPTRISFQVTSRIDSRTILGEQGAEQLLGQGDMLYMAGGGRISRVHGPFVSDGEVERIVAHLKTQGQPEYLDAITAEDAAGEDGEAPTPGGMDAEESGDLYDRAVAIVLRDRKCSTSYIQRRLSVGYNKAASLVERMEKEGVVGAANHAGKRQILVGGGIDRGAFSLPEE